MLGNIKGTNVKQDMSKGYLSSEGYEVFQYSKIII